MSKVYLRIKKEVFKLKSTPRPHRQYPGPAPKHIILKFQNAGDKEKILRASWRESKFTYKGPRITKADISVVATLEV